MAILRRNPLTQKWIVYSDDARDITCYRQNEALNRSDEVLYPLESRECPYCPESTVNKKNEILSFVNGRIRYRETEHPVREWTVRVIANPDPVFRIEDELSRRANRLYDVMGSKGAHELIIMTPEHGRAMWRMSEEQIEAFLTVYRERIVDLYRDTRLGHQYAFHMYGQEVGMNENHAVLHLIAAPFVPEKIQKELSGAHEWYKFKERCLFCDVYEEELSKRERGKEHGIIDESAHFTAFIPFFASHPFETWVLPKNHYSDFPLIPDQYYPDLAHLLSMVLKRLRMALGPFPMLLSMISRPNIEWGSKRGYWHSIEEDWHWRIRILPDLCCVKDSLRMFYYATGSRINPLLPESGARYLRSAI